jgi:hypothetical protein
VTIMIFDGSGGAASGIIGTASSCAIAFVIIGRDRRAACFELKSSFRPYVGPGCFLDSRVA